MEYPCDWDGLGGTRNDYHMQAASYDCEVKVTLDPATVVIIESLIWKPKQNQEIEEEVKWQQKDEVQVEVHIQYHKLE